MSVLCEVCSIELRKDNLEAHVAGKKHVRMLKEQKINERSVCVSPIPKTVSYSELLCFFSQYGSIKTHFQSEKAVVFEYNNRKTEDLFQQPLHINNEKLELCKRKSIYQDQSKEEAMELFAKKDDDIISYHNIKHIFEKKASFDSQLHAFLNAIQLDEAEFATRYDPIPVHLESIFKPFFKRCRIFMFGSTQTGLGFKGCDLDIFMDIGARISVKEFFKKTRSIMYRHKRIFSSMIWIAKAKTPIIKFCYVPTNVSCDLSFTNRLGFNKTNLLKYCLFLDDRVKPLMKVIKYWARHFKLSQTGKISNFALTLLIIFFLQQSSVGIIPPIIQLQGSCIPHVIEGWQVNFIASTADQKNMCTKTIPELLHAFFSFYATLDYESLVICPIDGMLHSRAIFNDIECLPSSMDRYKTYVKSNSNNKEIGIAQRAMCVQDPVDLSQNVTSGISPTLLNLFVRHCAVAADACASAAERNNEGLIPELLTSVPKELVKSRFEITLKRDQKIKKYSVVTSDPSQKRTKSWWWQAHKFVEGALKKLFGLQVEVMNPSSDVNYIILSCRATWHKKEYRAIFDDCESSKRPAPQSSDEESENSNKPNDEDVVNLDFTCTFRIKSRPMRLHVIFTNQEGDDEILKIFVNSARLRIPSAVRNAFSDLQQLKE